MSYILDALKKAEAERQLGAVPNLHVQPAAGMPSRAAPSRSKTWLIIAATLVVCLAAFLAWLQPWRQMARPAVETSSTIALAALPAVPAPAAAPATPEPPRAEVQALRVEPIREIKPKAPASRKPAAQEKPAPMRKPSTAERPRHAEQQSAVPATKQAKAPAAVQEQPQWGARESLPENIRRELPGVTIGGYIYSENPRERQLLANKRLLHEGEEAAPGVVLEKMLPRAAVFNYKGHRYQVPY